MYFLTAGVRFSPSLSELSVLSSRVVFVPCTHTHFLSDDPSSFPLYSFPLVSLSLPPLSPNGPPNGNRRGGEEREEEREVFP